MLELKKYVKEIWNGEQFSRKSVRSLHMLLDYISADYFGGLEILDEPSTSTAHVPKCKENYSY